jgi:ABC-2 type transport system ATP-binding protein
MKFHAWCGVSGEFHGERAMRYSGELVDRLSLQVDQGQLIGSYSFGMKRKLQLICCLMRRPELVIVDEPRNGLDPVTADELACVLHEHRERGAVIVAATHDLDFAERESTHVVVLVGGRLRLAGPKHEVFGEVDARHRYREWVNL